MRKIKIAFRIIVFLLIGSVLHYALPQHDIVRVVNTYQERQDLNDWTRIFWAPRMISRRHWLTAMCSLFKP